MVGGGILRLAEVVEEGGVENLGTALEGGLVGGLGLGEFDDYLSEIGIGGGGDFFFEVGEAGFVLGGFGTESGLFGADSAEGVEEEIFAGLDIGAKGLDGGGIGGLEAIAEGDELVEEIGDLLIFGAGGEGGDGAAFGDLEFGAGGGPIVGDGGDFSGGVAGGGERGGIGFGAAEEIIAIGASIGELEGLFELLIGLGGVGLVGLGGGDSVAEGGEFAGANGDIFDLVEGRKADFGDLGGVLIIPMELGDLLFFGLDLEDAGDGLGIVAGVGDALSSGGLFLEFGLLGAERLELGGEPFREEIIRDAHKDFELADQAVDEAIEEFVHDAEDASGGLVAALKLHEIGHFFIGRDGGDGVALAIDHFFDDLLVGELIGDRGERMAEGADGLVEDAADRAVD